MLNWLWKRSKSIDQVARELDGVAGGRRVAGQVVTQETALQVTAVMACVEAIATACAMPPMHVMRWVGDGQKKKATDHPAYRLLHRRPNEWQTSYEFRQTITAHAALTGNGFALPVRVNGKLVELIPVLPGSVTIERQDRYNVIYAVRDEYGVVGRFRPHEIFHLRNLSWDRIKGLEPVAMARKAIGLAMASEDNMAKLHGNGSKVSGFLSTENKLDPETIAKLKDNWTDKTTGANAFKTPVLDNGFKYNQLSMSAVDAQAIETRRMQVEEICRAFGVFPQIIMHSDKALGFANAEAFFSAHNRITAGKWQENWCQKADEFILDGDGPLFVEFDNRNMNAASLKDRGEYYGKALGTGGGVPFMTVNEVRADNGLPPIDGGDVLREPASSTMAPSGETGGDGDAEK